LIIFIAAQRRHQQRDRRRGGRAEQASRPDRDADADQPRHHAGFDLSQLRPSHEKIM